MSGALSMVSSLTVADPHYRQGSSVSGGYFLGAHPRQQLLLLAGGGSRRDGALDKATIRSYSIDKATGQLSERSVQVAESARPYFMGLAVTERHAYVQTTAGNIGSHRAWARYNLDPATGALDACANCSIGLPARADISFVAPSPDGRFVYSNDRMGSVFTSALQPDGVLLDIARLDVGTNTFEASAALGQGFLAVNTGDPTDRGGLLTLAVDSNTGLLSPRHKAEASRGPVVVSSTGLIALWAMTAPETYAIAAWSADSAGALTLRDSVPVASNHRGLAFEPAGRFLYASGVADDGIMVFAVEPSGALRTLPTYRAGGGAIVVVPK